MDTFLERHNLNGLVTVYPYGTQIDKQLITHSKPTLISVRPSISESFYYLKQFATSVNFHSVNIYAYPIQKRIPVYVRIIWNVFQVLNVGVRVKIPNVLVFQNYIECESDQFRCNSGTCIHLYLKCDNKMDCEDGSDEINCNTSIEFLKKLVRNIRNFYVKTKVLVLIFWTNVMASMIVKIIPMKNIVRNVFYFIIFILWLETLNMDKLFFS